MTPTLEAKCNLIFDDFVAKLKALQPGHFIKYKEYFQGLPTPQSVPADGNKLAVDRTLKPHDRNHSWEDFKIIIGDNIEGQLACDTYHNGDSHGCAARMTVIDKGVLNVRGENIIGTDAEFTHGWREIAKF